MLGDHTECFEVDFDPAIIDYEDLLERFWQSHDPTRAAFKTQYASVILATDDEQLGLAQESAEATSRLLGRPLSTRIERLDHFWMAEDYHQKYYLRNDRVLAAEFRTMFGGDEEDFRESTAAMKVNSFVAGCGSKDQLKGIIGQLGLSETGLRHLEDVVATDSARAGCRL